MRSLTRVWARLLIAVLAIVLGTAAAVTPKTLVAQATGPTALPSLQAPRFGDPALAADWYAKQRLTVQGTVPAAAYLEAQRQAQALGSGGAGSTSSLMAPRLSQGASNGNANQWNAIGPAPVGGGQITAHWGSNVATWNLGPTSSGRVNSIAVVNPPTPARQQAPQPVLYIGSAGGGVWASNNNGGSWRPLTDSAPSLAISAVAVDPNNSRVIYAGTGEPYGASDSFYGVGLLQSTDGGATWATISDETVFLGQHISAVLVSPNPSDGSRILVAVETGPDKGLYLSTNQGATWTQQVSGAVTALVMHPTNSSILYAAKKGVGVLKSTDGGSNWSVLSGGLPSGSSVGFTALAISPSNPSTVYASIGDTTLNHLLVGLYVSTNDGATWTKNASVSDYTDYAFFYGGTFGQGGQSFYDNVVAISPVPQSGKDVICAGGVGLTCSVDGGSTWTADLASASQVHSDFHALRFDGSGNLYLGNDGGIWMVPVSQFGANQFSQLATITAQNLNANLSITQLYPGMTVYNDASNNLRVLAGAQDNHTSRYSGSLGWTSVMAGDGLMTAVDPNHPSTMYAENAGAPYSRLWRSTDAGQNWFEVTPPGLQASNWVAPLVLIPSATTPPGLPTIVYGGNNVYYSPDGGNTWQTPNLSSSQFFVNNVSALAYSPSNPQVVYAAFGMRDLWMSVNGGQDWTWVGLGLPYKWITSITVSPTNPYAVYLTMSGYGFPQNWAAEPYVLRTDHTDAPLPAWTDITGNLPRAPVNALVQSGNSLIVASDVGVFASGNAGQSWSALGQGMPNTQVMDIKLSPDKSTLYAATHGRGVWSLPVSAAVAGKTVVTGVSPNISGINGGNGGNTVTITGSGFTGATAVHFGLRPPYSFLVNSDTQITAVAPVGGGTVDVTVDGAGGISAPNPADQFTYTGTPALAAVTPNVFPYNGAQLTLTGSGFGTTPGTVWFVAPDLATYRSHAFNVITDNWTDTSVNITLTSDYLPIGPISVYVRTSNMIRSNFLPATAVSVFGPYLSSLQPAAAVPGSTITVNAAFPGSTPTGVRFTQQPNTYLAVNCGSAGITCTPGQPITVTVPAGLQPGSATVAVRDASSILSNPRPFVVLGPPNSLTVQPAVNQTGANGLALVPIHGSVVDANGNGIPGLTVSLQSSNPSVVTVLQPAPQTKADGSFTSSLVTTTTPGTATITAAVTGIQQPSTFTFSNYAVGSASAVTLLPGSATVAPGGVLGLSGVVKDASGNLVPGASVAVSTTAGSLSGGGLSVSTSGGSPNGTGTSTNLTTGPDGSFALNFTAPVAASFSANITANAGPGITAQATVTPAPGTPTQVVLSPASSWVQSGANLLVTATAKDFYNQAVPGAQVGLMTTEGSVTASLMTTGSDGSATFTLTAPSTNANTTLTLAAFLPGTVISTTQSVIVTGSASTATWLTATNPSSVTAGGTVTLQGTVKDQYANPVVGTTVALKTSAGTLAATSTSTDGSGNFSATLQSAPTGAGSVTVTATVGGTDFPTALIVSPAAIASFGVTAASNQVAGGGFTLTLTALDPYGNPVNSGANNYTGDQTITFSNLSPAPGGKPPTARDKSGADVNFGTGTTVTFSNGVGTSLVTAYKTGAAQTVIATDASGKTGTSNSFTVAPAALDHFTVAGITSPTTTDALQSPVVTAYDAYNNVKTDYAGTITFSVDTGSAGATLPANYTFVAADHGSHTFTGGVHLTTVNSSATVTVTDTITGKTGSQTGIVVNTGGLDHFTVTTSKDGATTVAGTPADVTVTAYDAHNQVKTDYAGMVTFSVNDGGSGLNAAALPGTGGQYTFTAGTGTHTFTGGLTLKKAHTNSQLTATDGSKTGTSAGTTVTPAALDHLTVTGITSPTTTDALQSPVVTAYDIYSNVKTDYAGTITFSVDSGSTGAALPANYTFVAADHGSHTFTGGVQLTKVNSSATVTVADGSITGSQTGIVVNPGALDHFTVTTSKDGATIVAGTAADVTVTAYDAHNYVKTDYAGTVTFSVNDGGSGLNTAALPGTGGQYTFTAGTGTHTFPGGLTLKKVHTNTQLTATDSGKTGTSAGTTVTLAAPHQVSFTPSAPSIYTSATVTLQGLLVDLYQNPVPNVLVTLALTPPAAGGLSASSATTASDGTFSVKYTAPNTAASDTATATVSGTQLGQVTITVSVYVPSAPIIPSLTLSVSPASVTVGGSATISGSASSSGQPVPNLAVSLSASDGWQSSVTTGNNGSFSATYTAGNKTGPVTITASATSGQVSVTASTSLTVTAGPPAKVTLSAPGTARAGASTSVSGIVTDAYGNPVAQAAVSLSASAGTVTGATTGSDGSFSATFTAPKKPGQVTLTASAGSASASASITVLPGAPAAISLSASPASVDGGASVSVSGVVTDVGGNPVQGASVGLSVSPGSISPNSASTGADGSFSATVTAPSAAGGVTVTATAGSASGSASFTVRPPAPPVNVPTTQTKTEVVTKVDTHSAPVTVSTSDNSVQVNLPTGSLSAGTTVHISQPAPSSVPPAPAGATVLTAWNLDTGGVQPSKPVQVTFHFVLPPGASPATLGLYLLVNGQWQYFSAGSVDLVAGTLTVTLPHLSTWAVMANPSHFTDVPESYWAFRAINELSARGIVGGFSDGSFQPESQVTRAQFVKLLLGTLGIQPKLADSQPFTDVSPDAWYAPYLDAAQAAGIFMGSDGAAHPDALITRQEGAALLMRAVAYAQLHGNFGTMPPPITFTDEDQIAAWAKSAAHNAALLRLMQGYPDGSFGPQNNLTRAEAATLMVRLLQLQQNQINPPPV